MLAPCKQRTLLPLVEGKPQTTTETETINLSRATSKFNAPGTEKSDFGASGAPGGGLWVPEEPENHPSGPGRPVARLPPVFSGPLPKAYNSPNADSLGRAEGFGLPLMGDGLKCN